MCKNKNTTATQINCAMFHVVPASACVSVCVYWKCISRKSKFKCHAVIFKASRFRSCTSTRNILNDYGNSGRAITSSAGRGADGRGDGKWQSSTCGTHTYMYVCVCVCGGSAPPAALFSPIKSFTMQTHALFQQLPRLLSPPQLGSHTQLYLRVAGLFFLLPQRLLGWPTVRILDAPHIQPGHDERPQHMRSSKLIAAQPTCFSYAFPPPPPLFGLAKNLQQVGQVKKHLKYISPASCPFFRSCFFLFFLFMLLRHTL